MYPLTNYPVSTSVTSGVLGFNKYRSFFIY